MRRWAIAVAAGAVAMWGATASAIELEPLGIWRHGSFGKSAAEISAYDPSTRRLIVVNGESDRLDVLDIADPRAPKEAGRVDLKAYGRTPNSVAVHGGLAAIAMTADDPQAPGKVVFLRTSDLAIVHAITVGAMPDMIAFSQDGRYVVTADEGEPSSDYRNDPEGSVSVIDLRRGVARARVRLAKFAGYDWAALQGVRRVGPAQTFAQDAEPEYVVVSPDSRTAYVTLQDVNGIAVVDLASARVTAVHGLGVKDWRQSGFDASDKDDAIDIRARHVFGVYQPDSIAHFRAADGADYLVTANEGDARALGEDNYTDEARVKDVAVSPDIPGLDALQRLKILRNVGDDDGDGTIDRLHALGARSISIWTTGGALVWDSGDALERRIAEREGRGGFNADHSDNGFDARSDDKGPEPEGLAVAALGGRTYAFVGLERQSAVAIFDITDPRASSLVGWRSERNYDVQPSAQETGDLGPEGVLFVPAADAPGSEALLVVTNEISSTTRIYAIKP